MPRTFGDGLVHMSHIDVMVYDDLKLHPRPPITIDETSAKIGKIIADELVEDGATLQMGARVVKCCANLTAILQASAPFPTQHLPRSHCIGI